MNAPGNDKLIQAACQHVLAEAKYNKEWTKFWVRDALPLSDERFWQLFPVFKEEVESYVFSYKRSNGTEQAAEEVARKTVTGQSERHAIPYTYQDAVGFAKSWGIWSNKIGRALHPLIEKFSDDSWSDFCDAIPLAGEAFAKRALSKVKREGFLDEAEVMVAIEASCQEWVEKHPHDEETSDKRLKRVKKWANLICEGENYCEMFLEEGVKKYYLSLIRDYHLTEEQLE